MDDWPPMYVQDAHLDDSQPWHSGCVWCGECGYHYRLVWRDDTSPACPMCGDDHRHTRPGPPDRMEA